MVDAGFAPVLPPDAARQLLEIEHRPLPTDPRGRDLRDWLWSSIDNRESRDLDQIEVAEEVPGGLIRVFVGVADVDARVPAETPLDRHAGQNTTSVYTGVETFPMLPEPLSTDLTSLNPAVDRMALVIEMDVNEAGEVTHADIYRALTHNHAQLNYDEIGAWLEGDGELPVAAAQVPGLDAQLRLQHEAAKRLRKCREQRGALDFETIEATPVMEGGRVVGMAVPLKTAARYLIEDFMIAANSAIARFLEASGAPSIQRVVRSPQRWPRIVELAARYGESLPPEADAGALAEFLKRRREADPLRFPDLSLAVVKLLGPGEYAVVYGTVPHAGHFGLAVASYTHSTAPNRRYPDLITQRLVKSRLAGAPAPYSEGALEEIAQHCTERADAARKVERLMRKVAAAVMLGDHVGQNFDAIVTGASPKGTYVRVLSPPIEGRVVRGEEGMDVGDHVRVRLLATDPERGFIDFAHVG
jgi:exoribonuclease-2